MRGLLKWGFRGLSVLVLAAVAVGLWKREEITRLMAVNTLFDADRIVGNFSNMNAAFLTRPVPRGDGPVSDLPKGDALTLPAGAEDWIEARTITGLVVLHNGQLVHESYYQGTNPEDRRISWSVAKSWLSLLVGQLLDEGVIPSLDVNVVEYVPEMADTAYRDATLRDVLLMMSGIEFNEDYLDPKSDINRMGRVIALGQTMDGFAQEQVTQRDAPGTAWKYTSIDTHVVGQVVRAATGRDVASLLSEKIVQPLRLESEPYYLTDGEGVAFVLGGLNMTTRDYARMGLLIDQDGVWDGIQLVPTAWINQSTIPIAPTPEGKTGYGFQWWIPVNAGPGEVTARGIYGQYVWIDRERNVVVAMNAADRKFRDAGANDSNIEMFRAIAKTLSE